MDRCRTCADGSTASPYASDASVIRAASRARRRVGPSGSASAMFSATVSAGTSRRSWNTMPMPRARASAGLPGDTGAPSTNMRPSSGV